MLSFVLQIDLLQIPASQSSSLSDSAYRRRYSKIESPLRIIPQHDRSNLPRLTSLSLAEHPIPTSLAEEVQRCIRQRRRLNSRIRR